MFGGTPQCLRGRFAEQFPVGDRKTAKLPEAVIRDDAGDVCLFRIRGLESVPHKVHSAQGEKTNRAHTQMFLAGGAKRSLGNTDGRADFGEIKRPIGIGLQEFLEPHHHGIVAAAACRRLDPGAFGKALHHGVNELLFQRPAYFRLPEQIRSSLGKLSDSIVQLP